MESDLGEWHFEHWVAVGVCVRAGDASTTPVLRAFRQSCPPALP
jgi:hypothetical protein